MEGMLLIVPPTCDLTVPLLGVFQMAGYADSSGYPILIHDLNIEFCKVIVSYAINRARYLQNNTSNETQLSELAMATYVNQYQDIKDYLTLLNRLRSCTDLDEYWSLVDYLRVCYDLYSIQFNDIRFRIDGFDSQYRWNIWADIEAFLEEYSNSIIMDALFEMVSKLPLNSYGIVGISVTFESQLFFALLICQALRMIDPTIKIVIGGGFINAFLDCAEAMGPIGNYCDCVFVGEGEALIDYLSRGRNDALWGEGSGMARYVTPGDVCNERLDVQPPRFTEPALSEYFSPKRIIPLRFSFDCYWGKCKFCTDKETHECLNETYDIGRMINFCVEAVRKDRIDGIYFLDSAIKPQDVKRFALTMINSGLTIPWGTNLRFEKAFDDESVIELMARSGCVFVKFGLESGSQRVLDLMQKGTNVECAASIVAKFRKHGVIVHTYVMVGYPGELPEDREKTKDFLLSDNSRPDNYNCSEFILYGTAAIAEEYRHKLIVEECVQEGWHSSQYESFTNDSIQTFVTKMREAFDLKYRPRSVLMSTGHTIAYADIFIHQQDCIYEHQSIKLSPKVLYVSLDGELYLVWWWRNRGVMYLQGEWATYLWEGFANGISFQKFLSLDLPQSLTDLMWNSGCFCTMSDELTEDVLPTPPQLLPEVIHLNHFASLRWYGEHDAS